MDKIVENLRQFGLNEKEISVYLGLISSGSSTASQISKTAQVNRGTTYDILNSLIKLGLVSYYKEHKEKSATQHFVAEPPERLVEAVENKKRGLETLKHQLKKTLPEMESIYEKSGAKPVVKYYEGFSGVKVILQDVLGTMADQKEKKYYVYSSADIRSYLYKAYPDFNKDRKERKIRVQAIAIGEGGELAGMDERKWLSKEQSTPTYVFIYQGKVAMISLDATGNPVGVIVQNQGLYETQEMIFQFNWEQL